MNRNTIDFKKNNYYAFLDIEFNTTGDKELDKLQNINKILSIGIIITDYRFNKKEQYYSLIKPFEFKEVYSYCNSITHLTTEEIKQAKSFNDIMEKTYILLKKYNVDKIFVYGNVDRIIFDSNFMENNTKAEIKEMYDKIYDLQPLLNSVLPYYKTHTWGLKQVCKYFSVNIIHLHNSLADANALMECTEKYISGFKHNYYYNKLKYVVDKKKRVI